jgi:ribonuclease J
VAFPEDDMLGIDLVIPDFTYLYKNKEKVKGLFLTHGHEDHIGSIPYFLREVDVPIYATKLTHGLLENKLKEHRINAHQVVVAAGETIKLGSFKVEFIRVTHSIADACALAIQTPVGMVVHSGDFKVDYTPIQGEAIDLQRFAELGKKGVALFLCESTNVMEEGHTMSESSVGPILDRIFEDSPKQRIMVATFSSNIHRIQQIVNSAIKQRRKVVVMGRSMANAVRTACELGYLDIPDKVLIEISELKNYPKEQLVVIMTGSQGEPMAALSRMAVSDHRQIDVQPNDKIIISASPIPGNEKMISKVINELMRKGADVVYEGLMEVHVSGHAKKEEIKLLHALLRPRYLMPVHGEYRHLKHHKDLAISLGMKKERVFILELGEVLELSDRSAAVNGSVQAGRTLVDGLGVGDVGNVVLRDRKHLSQDGLMIAVVIIEKRSGAVVGGPDIISRGFVYVKEAENLIEEARSMVQSALQKCGHKNINEWSYMKNLIKDTLREFLWQKTKRSPMILPIIMEV